MPSLKDLAKECGVSVATVSKALNDQPDIAPATRERIRAAARRMGYLPNAAARALKTNRTYNLGVLFVDEKQSGLTHEYFSAVLDSFKVEAEKRGYDITFITHNMGHSKMTYLEHCRYRNVDGVCIVCSHFDDGEVLQLVSSSLPLVTIDHVFNNRACIQSENRQGVEALTRHVLSMGHKKIAFVYGAEDTVSDIRLTTFLRTMNEAGLSVPDDYLVASPYHDPASTREATAQLLALADRPTCILMPDDFSSIGGGNAIRRMDLRFPEDVSAAGYDGIQLASVTNPAMTTYRQDTAALGKTAAAKLIELIEKPRTALVDRILIPGKLVEGGSVRAI